MKVKRDETTTILSSKIARVVQNEMVIPRFIPGSNFDGSF